MGGCRVLETGKQCAAKPRRTRRGLAGPRSNCDLYSPQIRCTCHRTDPVLPGNHLKLFNGVLARAKLKLDREGHKRTAYSLRHTYICMRLMEGADIYQIAKNCRSSIEMIEKFYAAHIKNTLDAAAINVMRSRTPKKPLAIQDEAKDSKSAKPTKTLSRKSRQSPDDQELQP